eukprot:8466554-Karenia_brevis.AAC.1
MANAIWAMESGLPNLGVANLGYGLRNLCNLSYAMFATWAMQAVVTRCKNLDYAIWAGQSVLCNLRMLPGPCNSHCFVRFYAGIEECGGSCMNSRSSMP